MSRTSRPSWWSFGKRSKAGADGARGVEAACTSAPGGAGPLALEGLENRSLLSIAVSVTDKPLTVHFTSSDLTDSLYLEVAAGGDLEYSVGSANGFSTDLDGTTLNVQTQDFTIDTTVASGDGSESGGVYLLRGPSTPRAIP